MNITNRIAGNQRGVIPTSPISGRRLEKGMPYTLVESAPGAMLRVIIPDNERTMLRKCTALPARGGVKSLKPGHKDGRGNKKIVEVRFTIPEGEHRLETKALLMTAGFTFKKREYSTVPKVLDAGSWTAWMQSHAGEINVLVFVRDRLTGEGYKENVACMNPKDEQKVEIQRAHGTSTNSGKCRKADKPTK